MVMAEYFIHDRLQELWQQINHLHLTYLDTEDSPQKIDQRNKLEACIREFLYLAPHNRKFCCSETAQVLHRSSSGKDFSGYRAALAWNAVSIYAGNLLSQPWRKEYRQIKTYSGFYKHQIEANLVGAEAMFEAMGYKYIGNGVLVLEGPVCPDRVTHVSQDSIIAFVECQILKTIWEEVSNNFTISWLDVLEFRETHLCSLDQSIRMLNYRYHERRYQEQHSRTYQQNTDAYATVARYGTLGDNSQMQVPAVTGMHSFLPHHSQYIPMNPHMPSLTQPQPPPPLACPGQCVYGSNPYYSYSTYSPVIPTNHFPRYATIPYPVGCPPKTCNGYCYPNACLPTHVYTCPVPTGQLIELEGTTQNGTLDTTDGVAKVAVRQQDYLESHKQLAKSTNLDSLTLSKSREDGAGTFESWDYVYRNLESQGYSKDLGERGDVLQQMEGRKRLSAKDIKRTKPSIELEDAFNSFSLGTTSDDQVEPQHVLKVNEALKRLKDHEGIARANGYKQKMEKEINMRVVQSSSFDEISGRNSKPPPPVPISTSGPLRSSASNGVTKTKTLPRERTGLTSPDKPNHTTTLDLKKLKKQEADKLKPKELKVKEEKKTWNCNACTFLNNPSVEICVICGKSKKVVDVTMAVGGSQCPKCTLVNPKDVSNCEACNASLLNSPTYI